jgi:S-adenosylmethionine:tRNA ribosyltransferase-isomerase
MKAATWPRDFPDEERLLVIDPRADRFEHAAIAHLAELIRPGDLLIVNDAATLPASFMAKTQSGDVLELRLLGGSEEQWLALAFGSGDFRTRTEDRPPPPALASSDVLEIGPGLKAEVTSAGDGRMIAIRFDRQGAELWQALFAHGRPIQYAHVSRSLDLWHVQTRFGSRPWAFEMPSAGRPLSWQLLDRLLRNGVGIARVTHAAGISSTGNLELDRRLPLGERSEIPAETVDAIASAKARGGRVIAVGTTVVRALESRAARGSLAPGRDEATLVIGPGFSPRICDALLTGMHPPGTSHFAVLEAFAERRLLERALAEAARAGYLEHEFGDSCIVLPNAL